LLGPSRAVSLDSPENARGTADEADFEALLAALSAGVGVDVAGGETSDGGGTALPGVPAERQLAAEAEGEPQRPVGSALDALPSAAPAVEPAAGAARSPFAAMPGPIPDPAGAASAPANAMAPGVRIGEPLERPADAPPM